MTKMLEDLAEVAAQMKTEVERRDFISDGWVRKWRFVIESHHAELTRLTEIADAVDPLVIRLHDVTAKLEAANARLAEWRGLVLGHNAECKIACDPDRCKYRPYLEASGRRCPECPANDIIEIPAHLSENGYG
jgi:hypothetical protein